MKCRKIELTLFNKSNHPYNQRLKKLKFTQNKIDISSINVLYPEMREQRLLKIHKYIASKIKLRFISSILDLGSGTEVFIILSRKKKNKKVSIEINRRFLNFQKNF